jgi:hypothetical protein
VSAELSPCDRARALFPNQGIHRTAEFLAQIAPRAIDYLEQAPVLALCFAVKNSTRADRLYIASRMGGPIARGERLRSVMAAVNIPYPLRKLKGAALFPYSQVTVRSLSVIDNSTLSQAIPETVGGQRKWLSGIAKHRMRMLLRSHTVDLGEFRWIVAHAGDAKKAFEVESVADYIVQHNGFEWARWTWDRAWRETELWHDRLASVRNLSRLPGGIREDTCIDLSDWPDHAEQDGFEFFKLATPSMIFEEGRQMRHCVASYMGGVMNGDFSLFSIRRDMRRLATLQLAGKRVVQLKGFANKRPPAGVEKAVTAFAKAKP